MNIPAMHVWFRQYAQQMGMQNTRAILPEQIDLLINTSISDTINKIVQENIGLTNDRVITDNSKIGQINALRTLYKVESLEMGVSSDIVPVPEGADIGLYKSENLIKLNDSDTNGKLDALFIVDLSINYRKGEQGRITPFYPIRLIDDAYLADTMQDFVLKPRVRTPVAVFYNNTLDLYLGENYSSGNGLLQLETIIPYKVRISYIATPAKVKYVSDIGGSNIDCDLPESMHVDILKHAVDLYNISIQGNLYNAQQQQQAQNREISRNQARPDNEGYQQ